MTSIPRLALLSAWNKTGIVDQASILADLGWTLISTGGTARTLADAGLEVIEITDLTGEPERFDGRVKTLHPAIHASILARRSVISDMDELNRSTWAPIDLVHVDLYPFTENSDSLPLVEAVELIDIGGVALLRAAAKNYTDVLVSCKASTLSSIVAELTPVEGDPIHISAQRRMDLAAQAFTATTTHDAAIADRLWRELGTEPQNRPMLFVTHPSDPLRYGENPDQSASRHSILSPPSLRDGFSTLMDQHSGGPLSYNNLLDLEAAVGLARGISTPPSSLVGCVIIKHNNPCGVAVAKTAEEAWSNALASDEESAFGCVVAFTSPIDVATSERIGDHFLEAVISPSIEKSALTHLSRKERRRILTLNDSMGKGLASSIQFRSVEGSILIQQPSQQYETDDFCLVGKVAFPPLDDVSIRLGMAVTKWASSNCIVLTVGHSTVGIGPGQTSRVEAARIALRRAGAKSKGSVMWSDAFLPFPDTVEIAAEAGVLAIVQPGGSIRDEAVTEAADRLGVAMIHTGRRLFRH